MLIGGTLHEPYTVACHHQHSRRCAHESTGCCCLALVVAAAAAAADLGSWDRKTSSGR